MQAGSNGQQSTFALSCAALLAMPQKFSDGHTSWYLHPVHLPAFSPHSWLLLKSTLQLYLQVPQIPERPLTTDKSAAVTLRSSKLSTPLSFRICSVRCTWTAGGVQ